MQWSGLTRRQMSRLNSTPLVLSVARQGLSAGLQPVADLAAAYGCPHLMPNQRSGGDGGGGINTTGGAGLPGGAAASLPGSPTSLNGGWPGSQTLAIHPDPCSRDVWQGASAGGLGDDASIGVGCSGMDAWTAGPMSLGSPRSAGASSPWCERWCEQWASPTSTRSGGGSGGGSPHRVGSPVVNSLACGGSPLSSPAHASRASSPTRGGGTPRATSPRRAASAVAQCPLGPPLLPGQPGVPLELASAASTTVSVNGRPWLRPCTAPSPMPNHWRRGQSSGGRSGGGGAGGAGEGAVGRESELPSAGELLESASVGGSCMAVVRQLRGSCAAVAWRSHDVHSTQRAVRIFRSVRSAWYQDCRGTESFSGRVCGLPGHYSEQKCGPDVSWGWGWKGLKLRG
eukprot:350630-Chlamydomonas_euryale.AAC.5